MSDNTFTENTQTNAEQLGKIRISNVNNSSTETTFTGGSQTFNERPSEEDSGLVSRRVSEPDPRISEAPQ